MLRLGFVRFYCTINIHLGECKWAKGSFKDGLKQHEKRQTKRERRKILSGRLKLSNKTKILHFCIDMSREKKTFSGQKILLCRR